LAAPPAGRYCSDYVGTVHAAYKIVDEILATSILTQTLTLSMSSNCYNNTWNSLRTPPPRHLIMTEPGTRHSKPRPYILYLSCGITHGTAQTRQANRQATCATRPAQLPPLGSPIKPPERDTRIPGDEQKKHINLLVLTVAVATKPTP
jgi:hypothetical protein